MIQSLLSSDHYNGDLSLFHMLWKRYNSTMDDKDNDIHDSLTDLPMFFQFYIIFWYESFLSRIFCFIPILVLIFCKNLKIERKNQVSAVSISDWIPHPLDSIRISGAFLGAIFRCTQTQDSRKCFLGASNNTRFCAISSLELSPFPPKIFCNRLILNIRKTRERHIGRNFWWMA